MATVVVCLDGTNQTKDQPHPTNIARIFDTLGTGSTDAGNGSKETTTGTPPMVFGKYLPGVGTEGTLPLKILGNLFGDGIAEPIVRGYTYLSRTCQRGDDIIVTGFSRGATAARALAGFVVGQGLLDTTRYPVEDKDAAYMRAIAAWYAYRKARPSLANQSRITAIGFMVGSNLPTLTSSDFLPPPTIKAVAVFDTVSSLGLPHADGSGDATYDFSICDTTLNDKVVSGFHALAADETRDLFGPTYWAKRANVTQQIFPGTHSDVGGGYPNRGLSDASLSWMLDNLKRVGVPLNSALLNPPLSPNSLDVAQDDGAIFPFNLTSRRPRGFPDCAQLSASIKARWGQPTEMLPGSAKPPYAARGTWADGRSLK